MLLAAGLPAVLWHDVVLDISRASDQRLSFEVLGWAPWVLMALGVLCSVPVGIEHLRSRNSPFHAAGTGAWRGWGVTLYLLGFGLATQVAQLHGVSA
ncbi:MAG: hypothetical protein JWM31_891 [Solirubrobacterales bacterium]|nr:hypothetical protein [Solirubrobacterales bacterium]